jgi:hypothetical protein
MIELRQLEMLLAVTKHGSFAAAAHAYGHHHSAHYGRISTRHEGCVVPQDKAYPGPDRAKPDKTRC